MGPLKFSHNGFRNWWAFQAELHKTLVAANLDAAGVKRVMARTQKTYSRLQFGTAATMKPRYGEHIPGYELRSQDISELQMRVLSGLIESFVLVERSQQRAESGRRRVARRVA